MTADTAETMRHLEETADTAMVGWAKAATEVERLTVELACMTAERDGYRDQLDADWQAKQISDLMGAVGKAHSERDEARAALEEGRAAYDRRRADLEATEAKLVEARAALDRVREYIGAEFTLTNVEMADLRHLPRDAHHEDCGAVWRGYFLRMVRAALDGSGT